jgi:ABC-type molybdate transport system substrate-binding protein
VSSSRNKAHARALLDYIKSPEARATFESFGFEVPRAVP